MLCWFSVHDKPYVELKDSDGRPDEIVANEAWENHLIRNQSIIVDLFHGQLKSCVCCIECGHTSVKFDPLTFLSLPLPMESCIHLEIIVVRLDESCPVKYGLRLHMDEKYRGLKIQLSQLCHLPPSQLLIVDVFGAQVRSFPSDNAKIRMLQGGSLFVYELPPTSSIPTMSARDERLLNSPLTIHTTSAPQRTTNIDYAPSNHIKDNHRSTIYSPSKVDRSIADQSPSVNGHEGGDENVSPSKIRNKSPRKISDDKAVTSKTSFSIHDSERSPVFNTVDVSRRVNSPLHHVPHGAGGVGLSQIQRLHAKHSASTSPTVLQGSDGASLPDQPSLSAVSTSFNSSNSFASVSNDTIQLTEKSMSTSFSGSPSQSMTGAKLTNGTADVKSQTPLGVLTDTPTINSRVVPTSRVVEPQGAEDVFAGFIVAMHRKMVHMDVYFLSSLKSRPGLFGTPLVLSCDATTTNQNLYQQVWSLVSRLVSPLPPNESSTANHAQDCDDSLGYEYPFTLKLVMRDGCACALCPWYRFCRGCKIECDDSVFHCASSFIAIDWEPTALHLRYHASQEKVYKEHETLETSRTEHTASIGLDGCLRAFTKEEHLGEDELYYCSKCRKHRLAAKKLQLWKLPPILIIHLKRFQFYNGRWVKSQKIVKFPMCNFDPTNYLVPRGSSDKSSALNISSVNSVDGVDSTRVAADNICDKSSDSLTMNGVVSKNKKSTHLPTVKSRDNASTNKTTASSFHVDSASDQSANHVIAGDSVILGGESNIRRTVAEGMFENTASGDNPDMSSKEAGATDMNDEKLEEAVMSEDYTGVRYNLYAMSCHSGILGGGHYVTYAKNPNGKWYCYNDSSCKEVNEDQMDTNSAYILFYERLGLDENKYMPDVAGKEPQSVDNDEEFEKDLKKMCVVQ